MGHPIHKHMSSGQRYDAKEAYNKDLSSKARMHYLENDIADHKGSPAHMEGGRKNHKMSNSEYAAHLESPRGKKEHGAGMSRKGNAQDHMMTSGEYSRHVSSNSNTTQHHGKAPSRKASPLNDFKGGYHKVQHAKGEAHKSPANNITYGDKSGPTGYIGEQRADDMKYNPVDDRAGMSRYKSDAQRKAVHASKADGGMSRQKYGGNKGDESRSRRDYSTNPDKNPMAGKSSMKDKMDNFGKGNKKPATEKTYGGNKGDESRSKRDY